MADISDVQQAIVSRIVSLVYPNGVSNQCALSDAGMVVTIYKGWPQSQTLDKDLAKGNAHVSVFDASSERDTTRYFKDRIESVAPTHSLTLTITGQTVAVAGTVSVPQNLCVVVQNRPYTYAVQATDTLALCAAGLLAAMIDDYPTASRSGAAITLPDYANLQAAVVGGQGTVLRNIKQQECQMLVSIWAPSPEKRTAIAKLFDAPLANDKFLALPDNTQARIIYAGTRQVDARERVGLYRRDIAYRIDYSTTITETATEIIANRATITAN